MNSRQRVWRNHVADDFNSVVVHDANVLKSKVLDAPKQCADARRKDFDAEEVHVGSRLRNRHRGFAHAAATLENGRCIATESARQIKRSSGVGDTKCRQQVIECAALRLS